MLENHLEKMVSFVGVVDAGSIRKYALSMKQSQPGVSQRISSLERLIGVPLLSRSQVGIQLTRQGRVIYDLGMKLIKEAQRAETALHQDKANSVNINFGTYDSVAIYLMPPVLRALQKSLPNVRIKLFCDRSVTIVKQVGAGNLDVGLCVVDAGVKRVAVTPLYEDRFGFYVNSSTHTGEESLISVMDATDNQGKTSASHLRSFGLEDFHQLNAPSFEVAKAMTLAGLGIGVLPHRVAQPSQHLGLLKHAAMSKGVPTSFGLHSFGFVAMRSMMNRVETKVLLDIIQSELAKSYLTQV